MERRAAEDRSGAELLGDVGRNVLRPVLGSVEGNDTDGIFILSFEQVENDCFGVSSLEIGF